MEEVIYFNSGGNLNSNEYLLPNGQTANDEAARIMMMNEGYIKSMMIRLNKPPGNGGSRTFTLQVNGRNTEMSITFKGDIMEGITCESICLNRWDNIAIINTTSGNPTRSGCVISLRKI